MGQFVRHVFVCTHGEYCPAQGAAEVHRALKQAVAERGLKTKVRINKAGCFDQCGHGPMVVVYPEDVWYAGVTPERARRILDDHVVGGCPVEELRYVASPGPNKDGARMAEINARRAGTPPPAPTDGD